MAFRNPLAALLSLLLLLVFGQAVSAQARDAQDESILNGELARQNNQSLLWGPYRPNLYFGIRPRIPKSIATALMWAKVDNYVDVQNSTPRHPALMSSTI
jgi:mannosyl-oligosaccharide glucosidase